MRRRPYVGAGSPIVLQNYFQHSGA